MKFSKAIYLGFLISCGACQQPKDITLPVTVAGIIPWDVSTLAQAPSYRWVDQQDSVWSMIYEGEVYRGKQTEIFAYYADPITLDDVSNNDGHFPGVILVHGGGGTAFWNWVKLWAERGYAALAMDLNGSQPLVRPEQIQTWEKKSRRLNAGGPPQSGEAKFFLIDAPFEEQWQFHAVANVIRAHSLIRSLDQVDPNRTAITGISWGGYLTCIVVGIDHRFAAAVPVYGSGFLDEGSHWKTQHIFDSLGEARSTQWNQLWDPSQYVSHASIPMLFINGTNDFAYHAETWNKTAGLATQGYQLLKVGMKHSQQHGASPREIPAFFDQVFQDVQQLPVLENNYIEEDILKARYHQEPVVKKVHLIYTMSDSSNTDRSWHKIPAKLEQNRVRVKVPNDARLFYLTATTENNLELSSRLFKN
ncbi:MAG: prolyl oligopeptidase family serine peptidase [Bacteroidota bacterium]